MTAVTMGPTAMVSHSILALISMAWLHNSMISGCSRQLLPELHHEARALCLQLRSQLRHLGAHSLSLHRLLLSSPLLLQLGLLPFTSSSFQRYAQSAGNLVQLRVLTTHFRLPRLLKINLCGKLLLFRSMLSTCSLELSASSRQLSKGILSCSGKLLHSGRGSRSWRRCGGKCGSCYTFALYPVAPCCNCQAQSLLSQCSCRAGVLGI
mmetsp:Transcript_28011/g.51124  ORF Transcript_28011/g.51124 Transcript_28011/m.51124 type:complete len:208 (-) Transcript_28011:360-983(-)